MREDDPITHRLLRAMKEAADRRIGRAVPEQFGAGMLVGRSRYPPRSALERDLFQAFVHLDNPDLVRQLRPAALRLGVFQRSPAQLVRLPEPDQHVLTLRTAIENVPAVAASGEHRRQVPHGGEGCLLLTCQRNKHRDRKYLLRHGLVPDYFLPVFECRFAAARFAPCTAPGGSGGTVCRRMKLVEPDAICVPATTPRTSPAFSSPWRNNSTSAVFTMSSIARDGSRRCIGCTPQNRFIRLQIGAVCLNAKMP